MEKKRFLKLPAPPAWHAELTTVGVTGTNGKTSTTLMVGAALGCLATPVGQVTTVGSFLDRDPFPASADYHGFIACMRAARAKGGRFAAIELTSESLAMGFGRAWPCRVGVFTNLTRDHLDAHGSAEHYLASKAQLFMLLPEGGVAVLNAADPASALLREVVPPHARVTTYAVPSRGAVDGRPELLASAVDLSWEGTRVALVASAGLPASLELQAIGEHFAENGLAALGGAIAAGVDPHEAAAAIARLPAPSGRFEVVTRRPHAVVDFAHTPDALRRTLETARRLCTGKLIVVFGAGGQRDQQKRPLMGEAAAVADRVLLTSDNPRGESPAEIALQIRSGIPIGGARAPTVDIELDRARAITAAIVDAGDDDVVVIAGKGHETTQTVGDNARPFSDQQQARSAHAARLKAKR